MLLPSYFLEMTVTLLLQQNFLGSCIIYIPHLCTALDHWIVVHCSLTTVVVNCCCHCGLLPSCFLTTVVVVELASLLDCQAHCLIY